MGSFRVQLCVITTDDRAWLSAHQDDALSAVEGRCEGFHLTVADGDWLDLGEDWHAL